MFGVWQRSHVYWLKRIVAVGGTILAVFRNTTPSSALTQNYKQFEILLLCNSLAVMYTAINTTDQFRNVWVTEVGVAGWAWSLNGK